MEKDTVNSFREKLNQHYHWPALYLFKFIVPATRVSEVHSLFPQQQVTEKTSAKGNYTSITIEISMPSADAVIQVYQNASKIEGVIAL